MNHLLKQQCDFVLIWIDTNSFCHPSQAKIEPAMTLGLEEHNFLQKVVILKGGTVRFQNRRPFLFAGHTPNLLHFFGFCQ